jgi:tryptophan synthase beta subunit
MNVFFQKIIGEEVRKQLQNQESKKVLPDYLVACV